MAIWTGCVIYSLLKTKSKSLKGKANMTKIALNMGDKFKNRCFK